MNAAKALLIAVSWTVSIPAFAQDVASDAPAEKAPQAAEAAKPADAAPKRAASSGSKQMDRLELGSTTIKGNAELPKVLYIVPWQSATAGDLDGRPVNSLLDEVFTPVDRDVFLRHVDYFGQLSGNPGPDSLSPSADSAK